MKPWPMLGIWDVARGRKTAAWRRRPSIARFSGWLRGASCINSNAAIHRQGPKGRSAVDATNTTYLVEFVQSPFSKACQDLIAGLQEFLRANLPVFAALPA